MQKLSLPRAQRGIVFILLLLILAAAAAYGAFLYFYTYSSGERAGYVQKLSKKGWVCKTWEGELNMMVVPGASPEKFFFSVADEAVASDINKFMGKRVKLDYVEKPPMPVSCFGDTAYFIKRVQALE